MELNQKGAIPVAMLVLIIAGIAIGIYLLVSGTGFFPSAQETYQSSDNTMESSVPYVDK